MKLSTLNISYKRFATLIILALVLFAGYSDLHSSVVPAGGDDGHDYEQNSTHYIYWDTIYFESHVDIWLWNGSSSTYTLIASNVVADSGRYEWEISSDHPTGDFFRLIVQDTASGGYYTMSDTYFSIESQGSQKGGFYEEELFDNIPKEEAVAVKIDQNSPNPFSDLTEIQYFLSKTEKVKLTLMNTNGVVVANLIDKYMRGGWHTLIVNGSGLSNGAYIVIIEAGGKRASKVIHKVR